MPDALPQADLEALEALEKAATPGPWKLCSCGKCGQIHAMNLDMGVISPAYDDGSGFPCVSALRPAEMVPNADLVVALRNAFKAMEAELRARREYMDLNHDDGRSAWIAVATRHGVEP